VITVPAGVRIYLACGATDSRMPVTAINPSSVWQLHRRSPFFGGKARAAASNASISVSL
jgi:hypothetical protein